MAQPVEYCEVCGLPPEYCEYGPCFELCKPWLKEHHTDLYPDLANVEFTVDQIQATNNAIEQRTKTTRIFWLLSILFSTICYKYLLFHCRAFKKECKEGCVCKGGSCLFEESSEAQVHHNYYWS